MAAAIVSPKISLISLFRHTPPDFRRRFRFSPAATAFFRLRGRFICHAYYDARCWPRYAILLSPRWRRLARFCCRAMLRYADESRLMMPCRAPCCYACCYTYAALLRALYAPCCHGAMLHYFRDAAFSLTPDECHHHEQYHEYRWLMPYQMLCRFMIDAATMPR